MKTKLERVIKSCTNIKQLLVASDYLELYAKQVSANMIYFEMNILYLEKVRELTGAVLRNTIDYKSYAEHLYINGKIDDMNDFIELAEKELRRLEV